MKKYLGLDLGTTTLGIVYSDESGIIHNKENFRFERGNYKKARERVINYVDELSISSIVIGLPLQIDRVEGERCKSVRRFADDLKKLNNNLDIYFHDESYSTFEAKERLEQAGLKGDEIKQKIDMISAYVILEDFLRSKVNEK